MAVKLQTIRDIRAYLTGELVHLYDRSEIRVISDMLIKTIKRITKLHQLYDDNFSIDQDESGKIIEFAAQLKTGKPVQYVLGETTFYNCKIKLDSSTLIPRPETEELVDLIITENKDYTGEIIDIGTGSGCIAIALALNLPGSNVTGTDISEEAISVARENATLNNAAVSFLKDDILSPNLLTSVKAGLIVSNPPYVRISEKGAMSKNVLDFEPHNALFVSDSDPLVFYIAILKLAENIMLPGGILYFEINEAMGHSLSKVMESSGYSDVRIIHDINNKERIVKGRKNGQ